MKRLFFAVGMAACVLAMGIDSDAQQVLPNPFPIPNQQDARPVPSFIGSIAVANPIEAPAVPQNPRMAPNPDSNGRGDNYMSDTYERPGPLSKSPRVRSSWLATLEGDPRFHPPTLLEASFSIYRCEFKKSSA